MASFNRRDIERLVIGFIVAVVFHVILFFIFPLIIKLNSENIPNYGGPVFVSLEEIPSLGRVSSVEKANPSEVSKRESVAREKKVVSQQKSEAEKIESKRSFEERPLHEEISPKTQKDISQAPVEQSFSREGEEGIDSIASSGTLSEVIPPTTEETKKSPSLSSSGDVYTYESENATEKRGIEETANEKEGGKEKNLALSKDIYSELDKLLKKKEKTSDSSPSRVSGSAGYREISQGEMEKNVEGDISETDGKTLPGGPDIQWDEPAQKRAPLFTPLPIVPEWVSRQGLTLRVAVSFELMPEGIVRSLKIISSSGYSDVDSAVLEALRRWRFEAISGTRVVRGKITYIIKPKG